jgi:hypothetical protein
MTTQTQNKRRQTSMPLAGFEPTIPVLKRAKTFHALDGAATVAGCTYALSQAISSLIKVTPYKIIGKICFYEFSLKE